MTPAVSHVLDPGAKEDPVDSCCVPCAGSGSKEVPDDSCCVPCAGSGSKEDPDDSCICPTRGFKRTICEKDELNFCVSIFVTTPIKIKSSCLQKRNPSILDPNIAQLDHLKNPSDHRLWACFSHVLFCQRPSNHPHPSPPSSPPSPPNPPQTSSYCCCRRPCRALTVAVSFKCRALTVAMSSKCHFDWSLKQVWHC